MGEKIEKKNPFHADTDVHLWLTGGRMDGMMGKKGSMEKELLIA